jgi:hypothetical protein
VNELLHRKKIRTEHEVKLRLPESLDWALLEPARALAYWDLAGAMVLDQITTYFDTTNFALAHSQALLKFVTHAQPLDGRGWLMHKETLDWSGCIRHSLELATDVEASKVIAILSQTPPCLPVRRARDGIMDERAVFSECLRIRQERHKTWARLSDGHAAEVSLDVVRLGDDVIDRFVELEVDGSDADCFAALERLADHYITGLRLAR